MAADKRRITIRALLLGHRIDISGLERPDMLSANPLAFHVGEGMVALYRFGVAVLAGLSPLEEESFLTMLDGRVGGKRAHVDDEVAVVEIDPEFEDRIAPGGPMQLLDFSPARFVILADALAKTVALGRDEREVNRVFDTMEPFAAGLAEKGRTDFARKAVLKLIGQALLAQHRVSGRVAVDEKPDVLWDRPDLERLFGRLEDEYELKERAATLQHKLDVIVETARALADIIDTNRSRLLEIAVVLLIVFEVALSLIGLWRGLGH